MSLARADGAAAIRPVDLALVAAVVVSLTVVVVTGGPVDAPRAGWSFAFVAVFGALVLGRRRYPVATLVASVAALLLYYAAGLPPLGVALPVAATFHAVAGSGRPTAAVAAAVALVVGSSGYRLLVEGDDPTAVLGQELVTTVALLAAAIALGDAARRRADLALRHAEDSRRAADEREREVRHRADAERLRIAQDLHDSLGHGITVVALTAADALDGDDADLRGHVVRIRTASRGLLAELRAVVSALGLGERPATAHGDLAALEELARSSSVGGVRVSAAVPAGALDAPPLLQHALHRVAREAVTNALRHAGATTVTITVDTDGETLAVEVADDGRGVGDAPAGAGIDGMRHRMALLGGWCDVRDRTAGGTVVSAGFAAGPGRAAPS